MDSDRSAHPDGISSLNEDKLELEIGSYQRDKWLKPLGLALNVIAAVIILLALRFDMVSAAAQHRELLQQQARDLEYQHKQTQLQNMSEAFAKYNNIYHSILIIPDPSKLESESCDLLYQQRLRDALSLWISEGNTVRLSILNDFQDEDISARFSSICDLAAEMFNCLGSNQFSPKQQTALKLEMYDDCKKLQTLLFDAIRNKQIELIRRVE